VFDVPFYLLRLVPLIMACARQSEAGAAWAKSGHLLTRQNVPSGRRLERAVGPPASRPTGKVLRLRRQLLKSSLLPPLEKSACRAISILCHGQDATPSFHALN
jgi:hypothetical protein